MRLCLRVYLVRYAVANIGSSARDGAGYALPILMVSANSAQKQVIMGLEQGANDYITKPFHRDELHVRIGAHIAASTLAATEREIRMPCALLHHCPLPSMRVRASAAPCVCVHLLRAHAIGSDTEE